MRINRFKFKNIILVFGIAFLLRLVLYLAVMEKNPDGIWTFDSYSYWQTAYNLFHHGVFSQTYSGALLPDYFRTPLYPLLIILFILKGSGGYGVVFFQVFLSSLTCVITALAAFELFKKRRMAVIAGLIMALDIPSIVFSQMVLTETLFCFLLSGFLYCLILFITRNKISLLISAAFIHGAMLLCRPIATFTVIIPIVVFLLTYKSYKLKFKNSIIYLLIFLIPLSPWLIRNKKHFDHYFISTIGSFVLLNYHAASIVSEKENIPFKEAQTQLRLEVYKKFKGDINKNPVEYAAFTRERSYDIILNNKLIFVKQHVSGVFSILFKPVRGHIDNLLGWTTGYHSASASSFPVNKYTYRFVKALSSNLTLMLVVIQLLLLLVIFVGFINGTFIWLKRYNLVLLFFFLIMIFYFANMTVPPFNEARFRLPIMPFLAIVSALGLGSIIFRKSKMYKRNRR